MKLGKYLLPVALMVVTDACSVYEQENTLQKSPMPAQELVFTAQSGEDLTKTAFQADQTSIWWSPQDAISVFYGASEGSQFTSTNTQEVAKAEFRGTLNAFTGESENGDFNYFWAVYPYSAAVSCDGNSVVAALSETQTGKAGSFAPNTNISIAKNAGLSLAFYNTCAWFRFSLKKEGVKRVIFRGNNNEDVAGTFRVAMGVDGRPTAPEVVDGEKEIVLKMAGNEAFEVGEIYYITLFPQVFGQGFTVTMETETETGSRAINASATYLRSKYNTGIDFDKDVVYQPRQDPDNIIAFADETAKAKLVAAFDTNADGELSIGEASAVTSAAEFKAAFGSIKSIRSLDEFQYFTGLTEIPESMFSGWVLLTSVIIPENIQTIGAHAFSGCSKLVSVSTIPDGVSVIGQYAFQGCIKLASINIPDGVQYIDSYSFRNCATLSSISIPEGVKVIWISAFEGCTGLTNLTVSDGVTYIGYSAFAGCSSLENIFLPENIVNIEDNEAFDGCTSISKLYLKNLNSYLYHDKYGRGWNVLQSTEKDIHLYINGDEITELVIPSGIDYIRSYAFRNCANLTSLTIPEGVTSIGHSSFEGCTRLTNLIIPIGVTYIREAAFKGCVRIIDFSIPEGVASIGNSAFEGCTGLTNLTIPEGVTYIGYSAFEDCKGLTNLTISEGIETIENRAFRGCTNLTSVTIKEPIPPALSKDSPTNVCFHNTNNCPIYVPEESVEVYKTAQYWSDYAARIRAIPEE